MTAWNNSIYHAVARDVFVLVGGCGACLLEAFEFSCAGAFAEGLLFPWGLHACAFLSARRVR